MFFRKVKSVFCVTLVFMMVIFSITVASKKIYAQVLTQTLIGQLDLHVTSSCENGSAIFKIRNVGDSKISSVNFKLFKVTQGLVVSKRRMSLKKGQTATFKVKNAKIIPDHIGLFIDTKTIPRPQKADVAIRCSK